MATDAELQSAFMAADKAGDAVSAKALAGEIRQRQSGVPASATPAPAPGPAPGPQTKPPDTQLQSMSKAAIGGATGALVMPWALMAGGALTTATAPFTGVGAVAGPAMMAVGSEMLAAQTASVGAAAAVALGGAALGAVSEPAGQLAENVATAQGASPAMAGGARAVGELGAGMAAGSVWNVTKGLALHAVPAAVRPLVQFVHRINTMAQSGGNAVGETVSSAVTKARAMLQDPALKEQPQHTLHAMLQSAAETHTAAAEKVASGLEAKARAESQQLMEAGHQKAAQITAQGMAAQQQRRMAGVSETDALKAQGKAKGETTQMLHEFEAAKVLAEHKAQAQSALEKGAQEAEKLRADAREKMAVLEKASQGKTKTAAAVLKMVQPKLANVGTAKKPTEIAEPLHKEIAAQKAAADAERKATDAKLREEHKQEVAAKESKGEFIDQLPEYKALRAEIATKIQKTEAGREASRVTLPSGEKQGLTRVKEVGVERAYQQIWDAISGKAVQTGVTPEGSPTFETFKTTDEALSHIRRKLNDAAYGKEAEGYGGLGQDLAKKMGKRIDAVQEAYAPRTYRAMQENYRTQIAEGQKFKDRLGRWTLSDDTDLKGLPNAFFKSKGSVEDLKALLGNAGMAERAGGDHLAAKLLGKDSKGVRDFLNHPDNRDWLDELPGVKTKGAAYLKDLEEAEGLAATRVSRQQTVAGKLQERAKGLEQRRAVTGKEAEVAARKAAGTAKGEAAQLQRQGQEKAKLIRGAGAAEAAAERQKVKPQVEVAKTTAQQEARAAKKQAEAAAQKAKQEAGQKAGEVKKEKFAEAKAVRVRAQETVGKIMRGGTRTEDMEHLINDGRVAEVAAAGKILAGMPDGRKAWSDSVARVVTKKSPTALANWWEVRGRDIAKAGGATAEQLGELEVGVQRIVEAGAPKGLAEAKAAYQKMLLRALGATMGAGVSDRL